MQTEEVLKESKDTADVPQFTSKTTFGVIRKFEKVVDKTIRTEHFLQASTDLTTILDRLGTSFLLAKKDMLGNIRRIEDHYKGNPTLYATLNTILEEESQAQTTPTNLGLGVIWLKRALEFLRAFISGLSREHHEKIVEESLRQTILQAYDTTLKPYHGVMTQFLFSNISRLAPCRKNLLRTLMLEQNATIDMVISDIDLYLHNFSETLHLLEELLSHYGLQSQEKV